MNNNSSKLRLAIITIAILSLTLILIAAGFWEFFFGVWFKTYFYFGAALLGAAMLVIARSNIPHSASVHIFSGICALVCSATIFSGTHAALAIAWALTFPVIALFLLSIPAGIFLALFLFAVFEIALFVPGASAHHYSPELSIITTCGYLVSLVFAGAFEYGRLLKQRTAQTFIEEAPKKRLLEALNDSCAYACLHYQKQAVFKEDVVSTEALNKTAIQAVKDILVELVHNAVMHGIETPAERHQYGKNATGILRLALFEKNGLIKIIFKDDGKGFDFKKIKAAYAKIHDTKGTAPSLVEALLRLGSPKSTKDEQVRSGFNIIASRLIPLQGTLSIKTCKGRGTAFIIELPCL